MIVELAAKEQGVVAVGPGGIVLDLRHLHSAALGKAWIFTKGCIGSVKEVEVSGAIAQVSGHAIGMGTSLKEHLALLETVAQLVQPMRAEDMGPIRSDGMGYSGNVDPLAGWNIAVCSLSESVLVKVTDHQAVLAR